MATFIPVALGARVPDFGETLARVEQIRSARLAQEQAARRAEQENAIAQLLSAQGPALVGGDPAARQSVLAQLLALGAPGAQVASPFVAAQLQSEAQRETPLSPAEARALGLPPGAVATRTAGGGVRVVYTPPQYGPETFSSDPIEVQVDGERRLALIGNRGTIRYLPPNVSIQTLKTGLQPVPIYDAQGNLTVAFPDGRGGLVPARLPEGHAVAPRAREVRAGTYVAIVDQAGNVINTLPVDVAGTAVEKALGEEEGRRLATADNVLSSSRTMLQTIDAILNHPAFATSTGAIGAILRNLPQTEQRAVNALLDQLRGQVFMRAYETLKGGGQITDTEGEKGEQAIARLDRLQSAEDLRQALLELREVAQAAQERALRDIALREARRQQRPPLPTGAGTPRPAEPPPAQPPSPAAPTQPSIIMRYDPARGRLVPVQP